MTKQQKTVTEIIPAEFASTLAEAVKPAAPPAARASELKARVMSRVRGKKSFDLMTIRAGKGEWISLLPGVEKNSGWKLRWSDTILFTQNGARNLATRTRASRR